MKLTAALHKKTFDPEVSKASTRSGYGDAVATLGKTDKDIVVLTGDLTDSTKSTKFANEFPDRLIKVGVAEQNLAGISAGLALDGKIPFMASYAVFSPGRNWDQVRVSICYSRANVKIVSSHAGLATGPDGATHQALEDIALTRVLPNLIVVSPSDYQEAYKATEAAYKHQGPVYIRLCRENTPAITTKKTEFQLGKAYPLTEGSDLTIVATGPITYEALVAAKKLKAQGISCEIINCPTIKPIDKDTIVRSVKKTNAVITLEEHQKHGGLGGAVAELLSQEYPTKMHILGVNDTFCESGTYNRLKDKYGLRSHHIVEIAKKLTS